VSVINGGTDRVTATVAVGAFPRALAVNPWTGTVYVTDFFGNTVSVLQTGARHER
jgi:DNA-binding beta-propeller fold protein YncE